jgi:epoxyqueuosine reductase
VTLTQAVKDEAYRLGFALAGVTTPEPPPHLPVYEHWLDMGRNGSMAYLADPRRREPRRLLPGCKSILVLAMRYPASEETPHPSGEGHIASYALGRDYHRVIPERLEALARFIGQQAGKPVTCHGYTDSGPLLERDLGQRAGLGWIGRNTCLLHPKIGSYFFLAELLLDIELEADPPFVEDRCGRCTRCLDACPTGCLLPDRTMDARRCISYLTIENKGEILPDLRPLTGDWVFGCDLCQQVCP